MSKIDLLFGLPGAEIQVPSGAHAALTWTTGRWTSEDQTLQDRLNLLCPMRATPDVSEPVGDATREAARLFTARILRLVEPSREGIRT